MQGANPTLDRSHLSKVHMIQPLLYQREPTPRLTRGNHVLVGEQDTLRRTRRARGIHDGVNIILCRFWTHGIQRRGILFSNLDDFWEMQYSPSSRFHNFSNCLHGCLKFSTSHYEYSPCQVSPRPHRISPISPSLPPQ